jgi:hypothetical protein
VEWIGGQAFPESGIIVLTAPPTAAGREYGLRTVPHELSHLVVHAATDNPFGGVPRWLDEGLAMYAEGELPSRFEERLTRAVQEGRLLSLRSSSGNFPTDAEQSLLGYAESHSVVKYMLEQYGRDGMARIFGVFRDGATPDQALRGALGIDVATLENGWRASIGAPALSVPPGAAQPMPAGPDIYATAVPATTPTPWLRVTPQQSEAPPKEGTCVGGILAIAVPLGGILLLASRARRR